MEVIIAGAGEAGTYLAKLLYDNKENITIIDTNETRIKYINEHYDFLTVKGSALSIDNLKAAGVESCDLFIAMTNTEEANILSSIIAKRLGATKVIARITNKEYIDMGTDLFSQMGIDELIYPEILASQEIVDILQQSGTKQLLHFSEGKLKLPVLTVRKDSDWDGMEISQIRQDNPAYEFILISVKRNGDSFIPQGKDKLQAHDLIFVITKQQSLEYLSKKTGNPPFQVKNVMIMGGSRIGYKTAMMLEKKHHVKLFEQDNEKCHELSEFLKNTLIINGDGRDSALLIEEGIEKTDAFIAVTGNSETNILACLHAKKFGVKKTVAEIENMDDLPLAQKMGINSVINKKLIAAGHIHAHVLSKHLTSVQCLSDIESEILEFNVPQNAPVSKHELSKLNFPSNAIIGGIIRKDGTAVIPKGNTRVEAGDKVLVCSIPDTITKASKFFKAK